MQIRNIQLKNGTRHPIGEAYREPIVAGRDIETTFTADGSDTSGCSTVSLAVEADGSSVSENTLYLFPIADTVYSSAELANISSKIEVLGHTIFFSDGFIGDGNTIAEMFALTKGIVMNSHFSGIAGTFSAGSNSSMGGSFAVASFSSSGTTTDTQSATYEDSPVSVTATVSVPAAGTYILVGISASVLSNITFSGTISVCKWMLDPRYYNFGVVATTNSLFMEMLVSNGSLNLDLFPAIKEKLIFAMDNMLPIWISGALSVSYNNGWTFANEDTLTVSISENTATAIYTQHS